MPRLWELQPSFMLTQPAIHVARATELGAGSSREMVMGIWEYIPSQGEGQGGLVTHQHGAGPSPATHRLCAQKAQFLAHSSPRRIHLLMFWIRLSALPCAYM